jgi:predicted GNAT family acetyltransferase
MIPCSRARVAVPKDHEMANPTFEITDNAAKHRYETTIDGHTAVVDYFVNGNTITFVHTGVPEELEGRGVGSALAKRVLDDARARGLAVVPRCPFIRGYIERHAEYADLVRK